MILLISYDLNGHERPSAYDDVKAMIVKNAISYKRPLYSQWFVETTDDVKVWNDRMLDVADQDDNWFICQVGSVRRGWLPKSFWSWLRENV